MHLQPWPLPLLYVLLMNILYFNTKPLYPAGIVYTNETAQSLNNSTQHPKNDMASHTLPNHIHMLDEKNTGYFLFFFFVNYTFCPILITFYCGASTQKTMQSMFGK